MSWWIEKDWFTVYGMWQDVAQEGKPWVWSCIYYLLCQIFSQSCYVEHQFCCSECYTEQIFCATEYTVSRADVFSVKVVFRWINQLVLSLVFFIYLVVCCLSSVTSRYLGLKSFIRVLPQKTTLANARRLFLWTTVLSILFSKPIFLLKLSQWFQIYYFTQLV